MLAELAVNRVLDNHENPPTSRAQLTPVGASLLAKASAHSVVMVTDTPFSRAGSLPRLE